MSGQGNNLIEVAPESISKSFLWKLKNFSGLTTDFTSKTFVVGGYSWQILAYPKGLVAEDHLSLYMAVVDPASLPQGWSVSVLFRLTVINQLNEARSVKRATKKYIDFHAKMISWGWPTFLNISELYKSSEGFLLGDTCMIKAELVVLDTNSSIAREKNKGKLQLTLQEKWEEKVKKQQENSKEFRKRRKTENEGVNKTTDELPNTIPLIKLQARSTSSQTAGDDFYSLLEDIGRVAGASPLGIGGNEAIEVSESLCLVKQVAGKPFCRIPSSFWPELSSALNVLGQATSLSSVRSSAAQEFKDQFEDLCRSYNSASAVLRFARERIESNQGNYLLLKSWRKTLHEIKDAIDGKRKEAEQLEAEVRELEGGAREMKMQLRGVKQAESLARKDFATAIYEAGVVKDKWDAFMANEKDELERDEKKAENEVAAIEAKWARFASYFK